MTVTLKDVDDHALWSMQIAPRLDVRANRVLSQHF
jgi:alkaline phosphatase D